MFGSPIVTLPHDGYTSQLQYRSPFHHHYIKTHFFTNQFELASLAPETNRASPEGLALYFLLLYTHRIRFVPLKSMTT